MNWLPSNLSVEPPVAVVSSASVGSVENAPQGTLLYFSSVTADRSPISCPVELVSLNLTGYVRPALPVFTVGGLFTGARKPLNPYRTATFSVACALLYAVSVAVQATACVPGPVIGKVAENVCDAQSVASPGSVTGSPSSVQETERSPPSRSDALTVSLTDGTRPPAWESVIVGGVVSGFGFGVHSRGSSMFGSPSPSTSPKAAAGSVVLTPQALSAESASPSSFSSPTTVMLDVAVSERPSASVAVRLTR